MNALVERLGAAMAESVYAYGPYLERKEARRLGLMHYTTGRACPRGHRTYRFVSNNMCAGCNREKSRAFRARYGTTPTAALAYRRILNSAKDRARVHGLKFSITKEQWESLVKECGDRCQLTGLPFVYGRFQNNGRKYRRNPFGPSIDRIVPSKGYVFGNVRIVCLCVNIALNEWGEDILFDVMAKFVKRREGSNGQGTR